MSSHPFTTYHPDEPRAALFDRALVSAFLENIPDYIYFKDRESRFIAVSRSKAAQHGLDPADLIGKTDADVFPEQHAQWARVDEENIINTGEPVLHKLERVVWPDGRETWGDVSKLPLRDETGEIIGTFGLTQDVTKDQELKQELEKAKRRLQDTSRAAGMAEVATGVLHNIGNVLTSLNVSASVISATLVESKAESLQKLGALLESHAHDLGRFIDDDPKGRRVPDFLESLGRHSIEERDSLLQEIASLQQNIDHIKEIVAMQQAYATMVGVVEPLDASMLVEDSVRMNAGALVRHDITVMRDFQPASPVLAEKAKVLQILVNLIRNAKYACDEGGRAEKLITVRVAPLDGHVRISVQDNGVGIPPENLARIFEHGFTTRSTGHGFGLHSAAAAAKDMQGTLTVHSDGRGHGATFMLDLPLAPAGSLASNAFCVVAK